MPTTYWTEDEVIEFVNSVKRETKEECAKLVETWQDLTHDKSLPVINRSRVRCSTRSHHGR